MSNSDKQPDDAGREDSDELHPTRHDQEDSSATESTRPVPDLQAEEPGSIPATLDDPMQTDPDATVTAFPEGGSAFVPGQELRDFALQEVLGSGAFATVYLARQISLGREVALKVSHITSQQIRDHEARTLATLEHEHIVRVHSEEVDEERKLRLLCMRFVPGSDLEHIIRSLSNLDPTEWSGRAMVEAVDHLAKHEAMFDVGAVRDRKWLEQSDFIAAVCWMGARLAEALSHAHRNGVLHRDIKPANILVDRYGRPLLSDFNLATLTEANLEKGQFGGTLRYMAPEHLDAFNPASDVPREVVNERCDVYSLGVVIFELLTGKPAFPSRIRGGLGPEQLFELARERRESIPSPRDLRADVPVPLNRVVRRCLAGAAEDRYESAEELVDVLEGCRELHRIECELPTPLGLARAANPRLMHNFLILVFLPHLIAEMAQIAYNSIEILPHLTSAQRQVFWLVALGYNVLIYGGIVWLGCCLVLPVLRCLSRLPTSSPLTSEEVMKVRQRALSLPLWTLGMSIIGWLPGGMIFPLLIDLLAPGELTRVVHYQFLASFVFAGLIATTYSCLAVQAIVIRLYYPQLWVDPKSPHKQARYELRSVPWRLRWLQFAGALIPLSAAILMMSVGKVSEQTLSFRLFVVGLLSVGMLGFGWALFLSERIGRILTILWGSPDRHRN